MEVSKTDLSMDVSLFASGWHTALHRPPRVKSTAWSLDTPPPRCVSFNVNAQTVKVNSFSFPDSPIRAVSPAGTTQRPATPKSTSSNSRTERTSIRIRPSDDIIKLQDRLYYVLQPPLESIISAESLGFPFEPFDYQLQGIAFLYPRHSAVLADEMGLGKTMQAITTIRLLLHAGEARQVLLICPKPLVTNWQREFSQWAPELPLAVIQGDQSKRRWQWEQPIAPVKIANYELLVRDRDVLDNPQLRFDLVVLDEAQRIKNRSSATSQVVKSISRTRSWSLTGTPVENSPEDLVGIFEFLSPGFLTSDMSARRMGQNVRDHVLRRTKDMVMTDLPPKLFRDAELMLTPEQLATYKMAEDEGVVQLTDMGDSVTIQHVFELVLRLKQICNFDPATGASSKLERLLADLEEVAASGQKAIVFSQWVQTLDRMKIPLRPYRPLEYHGQIPARKRDSILHQFRDDPDCHVLLMSYGAGSVGLNLQFCSYVFLFDRWWNPAVEDQAINRAHRIGVAGPVTVTRMLTQCTIEERINQVLQEKRELFATIFEDSTLPTNKGLSQQEIFGLFNLRMPKKGKSDAA